MWFTMAVLALLFWSGSDFFSKLGTTDGDNLSQFKVASCVGLVMGIHAFYEILFNGVTVSLYVFWEYLPAIACYIISMVAGYVGLRFIELSVSSPICNCSGAFVSILCLIFLHQPMDFLTAAGTILMTAGVFYLGVAESKEDDTSRAARQKIEGRHYKKTILAILIPLFYCLLDTLGTFADSAILEHLDEDSANCAYELTWLVVGILCFLYVKVVKKEKYNLKKQTLPIFAGAICETVGQVFYVIALAENAVAAAPLICCYCAVSCIWAAIFLKERLTLRHYAALALTFAGIVVMGFVGE